MKLSFAQLRAAEDAIFKRYSQQIISDGALGREYLEAKKRVLVILKEPNDEDGSRMRSGGDIRHFGSDEYGYDRGATWNNLARWSALIQDPKLPFERARVAARTDVRWRRAQLRCLAVVNLKKTPGRSKSKLGEIRKFALSDRNAHLLREQLKLYKPDLTISCGTFGILSDLLDQPQSSWLRADPRRFHSFVHDLLGKVIDFYHPQSRKSHQELYRLLRRDLKYHRLFSA